MFGEPLDHGDEPGAPGFEAEGQQQEAAAAHAAVDQGSDGADAKQGQAEAPRAAGEMVAGRVRAVSDGSAGDPPGTAIDRCKIAHWQQAGGYKDETVAALADLACGEKILERLSAEQVRRVAWLLELAAGGRVSQRTLAGAITRATRRYDLKKGAEELESWLRIKADEVGLLGRREAA